MAETFLFFFILLFYYSCPNPTPLLSPVLFPTPPVSPHLIQLSNVTLPPNDVQLAKRIWGIQEGLSQAATYPRMIPGTLYGARTIFTESKVLPGLALIEFLNKEHSECLPVPQSQYIGKSTGSQRFENYFQINRTQCWKDNNVITSKSGFLMNLRWSPFVGEEIQYNLMHRKYYRSCLEFWKRLEPMN